MRKMPNSDTTRPVMPSRPTETRKPLRLLYERLSAVHADMQGNHLDTGFMRLGDQICLIVLEDDLLQLIEECEEFFISRALPTREQWESLESRAACVIEELKLFMPKLDKPRTIRGRTSKPERSQRLNA